VERSSGTNAPIHTSLPKCRQSVFADECIKAAIREMEGVPKKE
jgi:hypothetical protein